MLFHDFDLFGQFEEGFENLTLRVGLLQLARERVHFCYEARDLIGASADFIDNI